MLGCSIRRTILYVNKIITFILPAAESSKSDMPVRERSVPLRLIQSALIVRGAVAECRNQAIAMELAMSWPSGQLWRQLFRAMRWGALEIQG